MKKLLVGLVFIIGCGNEHKEVFAIAGFETYYSTFVQTENVGANDLIIKFGNVYNETTNIIGFCLKGDGITPTVTIDSAIWANLPEVFRQELIDHELGHCILNRVHRTDMLPNGYPASIMYPSLFDAFWIQKNQEYYNNELVGK